MTFKSNKSGALEPSGARHLVDNIEPMFDKDADPPRDQKGKYSERTVTFYKPKI